MENNYKSLRDVVLEKEPDKRVASYCGVAGCPGDYPYLDRPEKKGNEYCSRKCIFCWHKEYGIPGELSKKRHKQG